MRIGGSIRPGLAGRAGRRAATTTVLLVEVQGGPERHAAVGAEEEPLPDVPAGLAAVLVVDRIDDSPCVGGAAGDDHRVAKHRERGRGVDDAVVDRAVVVLDLLEREKVWRSQVVDDDRGKRCELGGPQPGIEFSRVKVAIASGGILARAVASRAMPPEVTVPMDVASSLKLPKS